MEDPVLQKRTLRSQIRSKIAQLNTKQRAQLSVEITNRVHRHIKSSLAKTVASFAATTREPDLEALLQIEGTTICYPKVTAEHQITFFAIESRSELSPGKYGILEPINGTQKIAPENIDLILCPGDAFSREGARLGKGGGYYDRYLSQTSAKRIGICFSQQLCENIPTEAHDQKMEWIITDTAEILTTNR